jgi:hypothetical protein
VADVRRIIKLGAGVAVTAVAAALCLGTLAHAGDSDVTRGTAQATDLISARHDCETFVPADVVDHIYAPDPDLRVRINNGKIRRDVVIQLSAEGATTQGTPMIGVRYSIDGKPFNVHGPEFFFSEPNFETHTSMSIVALGPGSHTIVPGYVVLTGEGTGQILFRCLSAAIGR